VIVLDANILLYAYDGASSRHRKARAWLEEALSSGATIGIPWQTAAAFVRIVTNVKLPGQRFTIEEAVQVVDRWLQQPNVRFLAPGEGYWPLLRQVMIDGQASGPLVSDAQLAALAMECGGVLHTTDRDFARFPGLRWTNPLA
jgi:toxin-antitoxin system PIN domain toxin